MILFTGCSSDKEEIPNYSKEEMLSWARAGDETFKLVLPTSVGKATVSCSSYTPSCKLALTAKIKGLEFKVLYYEKQSVALEAAKRIKGYVARNWVFDDIKGEPILERYAKKHLKAVDVQSLNK